VAASAGEGYLDLDAFLRLGSARQKPVRDVCPRAGHALCATASCRSHVF